ncbi:hypothetical protein EC396_13810 [Lutibacter sp. HS1-25]|uniref:YceI family protein n=1 Tax=Lutibacter sp. HS1-25 TaxID=2485000 RepID=UPI001010637E|nr:YceI family protein [Lutibacter sp. HS1-25]RXP46593.1 hypothetical protein EC396_13810 [Lutibacter sp. HS1-25]
MKKIYLLSLLIVASSIIVSCKENVKKEETLEKTAEKNYVVDINTTTINWTAYKTTSKVPVKGKFSTFTVENVTKANSAKEALDNLKFSIPVNSLSTNDTIRDAKLKKFFFGSMENTAQITGTLHMENETAGSAEITMNGVSQQLPITYVISDQMVSIEAVMDLDNWKTQTAIEALNLVCKDLHKGEDGISKTWSEVKIEVVTYLKTE